MLHTDFSGADARIADDVLAGAQRRAVDAHNLLVSGTGPGNKWLGWRTMLAAPNDALLERLDRLANEIREEADVLVCVGIGGSYLGADAVIAALAPAFRSHGVDVIFAGHHLSGTYLDSLLRHLEGKSVYVNVISKSGTTLEPALAFRVLRGFVERSFDNPEARIVVTTSRDSGALQHLASDKGYRQFVIPDDVGGRFSVLTPVGLLPIAVAGLDIRSLFYGAVSMYTNTGTASATSPQELPAAAAYAARRIALYESGYKTELLATMEPELARLGAWWQQLFGESEGKDGKGLFPAVSTFTTDLHSLGQFIQDGDPTVFESFLIVRNVSDSLTIPETDDNLDGLNYLAGRTFSHVNRAAFEGTREAHSSGTTPVMQIALERRTEEHVGAVIYFFQHAVAVGAYMLGVNPFDQPGVEAYKKGMLSRLKQA
ncbi:MAG: glucose-6-phosphate isomerase [Bacteroidetes bacterium CG12_big_fil_rev_8_21_14_0_65_60_17]|nr:MAG: glucose-6-phosphate isomerase [Bacteroidetes bacterium CG12_big_fil_rev_8_21_14_0_65_60_17]